MAGTMPAGPVVVFDDDHYYLGGVVAEALRGAGLEVTLATPANEPNPGKDSQARHRRRDRDRAGEG